MNRSSLSIQTDEADRPACELSRFTGDNAVTIAVKERLARERASQVADIDLQARITAHPPHPGKLRHASHNQAGVGRLLEEV